MQPATNDIIKVPEIKGKPLSLRQSHHKTGVKDFKCSDFLPSLNLLAEGEYNNQESRNAKVVFTDLRTGELRGEFS